MNLLKLRSVQDDLKVLIVELIFSYKQDDLKVFIGELIFSNKQLFS